MKAFWLLIAVLAAVFPSLAAADLVVVANPVAKLERLSKDQVVNFYMGRVRRLPDGTPVYPVDLARDGGNEKAEFYQRLLGRDLAEVKAYWVRLTFTGQASPPVQAGSAEQVLDFVRRNPGGVGYVERSKVDSRVRIVFEFGL
ncbi:hypothetical protein GCM10025771_30950 [Niveibacterium umoris]|uniref:ABC-type phosphate transport system substrate-binding protein n=1 Tax=Niveibacterium umoris TaxID=1193620 RepID=A0A840BGB8_9RHOO|nr:hypothetical protein [Niveibacterium umoris]MBB4011713.1 ABC-type phosphate transport system substrate-binding protein [Niveibacterium umoris]